MNQSHFLWHLGERPEGCLIIGPGGVCSKDANGCSGRGIGDLIFAVEACQQAAQRWRRWKASQQYRATEQGKERRRKQSKRYRQRQRERQAASADADSSREGQRIQRRPAKIFRERRAIGRGVTSFSPFPMNIRTSVFAVWRADWLCVACWIGKHVIRRGGGACVVSA